MIIDFSKLTASDYAAWWGASIATLALLWNIIVALRSGARIKVRVIPNMKIYPQQPITGDKTYISVNAVNRGTLPTTITHFEGFYSSSLWSLIRGQKQPFVVNTHPAIGQQVPYVLAPGEEWRGMMEQKPMEENDKINYLYLGIIHNQRKRPIFKRVKIKRRTSD